MLLPVGPAQFDFCVTAYTESTADPFVVVEITEVQLCLLCFMFMTRGEFNQLFLCVDSIITERDA